LDIAPCFIDHAAGGGLLGGRGFVPPPSPDVSQSGGCGLVPLPGALGVSTSGGCGSVPPSGTSVSGSPGGCGLVPPSGPLDDAAATGSPGGCGLVPSSGSASTTGGCLPLGGTDSVETVPAPSPAAAPPAPAVPVVPAAPPAPAGPAAPAGRFGNVYRRRLVNGPLPVRRYGATARFGRLSLLSGRCAAPHRRLLYGG